MGFSPTGEWEGPLKTREEPGTVEEMDKWGIVTRPTTCSMIHDRTNSAMSFTRPEMGLSSFSPGGGVRGEG